MNYLEESRKFPGKWEAAMRFDLKISKSSEEFTAVQLLFDIVGHKDRSPFISSIYPGHACGFYLSDT